MVRKFLKSVWRAVLHWVYCRMWPAPEQVDALVDALQARLHEWCAGVQVEAGPRAEALADRAMEFLLGVVRRHANLPPIVGPLVRKFVERYLENRTAPIVRDLVLAAQQGVDRLCAALDELLERARARAKAAYCPLSVRSAPR